MQMEEDRLDDMVAEGMSEPAQLTLDRKVYFRELFRLQHELVRLQDWVQHKKLKVVVIFEGPRFSRQGWRNQAGYAAPQSTRLPCRCLAGAHGT